MPAGPVGRVAIDTVEIARVERMLRDPAAVEGGLFSADELADAGSGERRAATLAARLAGKEACLKLFPREAALGRIEPADFRFARSGYGAPELRESERVLDLFGRYRIARIAVSFTHEGPHASAVATAEPLATDPPALGRWIYRWLPIRRAVILDNLRRAFGAVTTEAEIRRLAEAHYAHVARTIGETLRFPFLSDAKRTALTRAENLEVIRGAAAKGKGVLIVTGHFGNWEVATVSGIRSFPEYRGRFHFVRRPLRPAWLDRLATVRFRRAGLGVLPKRGALDAILERLAAGDVVVFVLDQHAGGRDGVPVEFFGARAHTFRSLATIALASGAPVVSATTWREPDGRHVLHFERELPRIEDEDPGREVRRNTQAYNDELERLVVRRPEQWFWIHRRWKDE